MEGTVLFGDDLGLGEILATETVDCNGTLGVAKGRGVVIGAIIAPAFVVIGRRDLLGDDHTEGQREEYGQ